MEIQEQNEPCPTEDEQIQPTRRLGTRNDQIVVEILVRNTKEPEPSA
jgi:hypothetical protein